MNKRQRKKNKKKRLPVIADEFNLLTMTKEEMKIAHEDYLRFVEKYAYRKKYKNLKGKCLYYYYPMSKAGQKTIKEITEISRKFRKRSTSKPLPLNGQSLDGTYYPSTYYSNDNIFIANK